MSILDPTVEVTVEAVLVTERVWQLALSFIAGGHADSLSEALRKAAVDLAAYTDVVLTVEHETGSTPLYGGPAVTPQGGCTVMSTVPELAQDVETRRTLVGSLDASMLEVVRTVTRTLA